MFAQPAAGLQVPIMRSVDHPCKPAAPTLYSSTRGVTGCSGEVIVHCACRASAATDPRSMHWPSTTFTLVKSQPGQLLWQLSLTDNCSREHSLGGGAGGGARSVQVRPWKPLEHLQVKCPKSSPQVPAFWQGFGLHGPVEPSAPPPALGSGNAASPLRKRHAASVSPSAKSKTATRASFPRKFRSRLWSARVPGSSNPVKEGICRTKARTHVQLAATEGTYLGTSPWKTRSARSPLGKVLLAGAVQGQNQLQKLRRALRH